MPDRRRHFLIALPALAAAGRLRASPASEERLRLILQAPAAGQLPPQRLEEREALLRDAEAALAAGDAAAAEQGFDRAAMILHSADTEMGLVRSYMQGGQYRRALAFGAHTAGAHLDAVGGAALYAWLLHAGGQDAVARRLLAEARARAPSQPLIDEVSRELDSNVPRARGRMLLPPARLAPYGSSAGLPRAARVTATATLVGDGGLALVPARAVLPSGRFWVRNGLGQLAAAGVVARDRSGQVALLRLSRALPAASSGAVQADAHPGSVVFSAGYTPAPGAEPAWPVLRTGFLGAAKGGAGERELDARPGGGPVFDQAGRLAGITVPDGPGSKLVAASQLRQSFARQVEMAGVQDGVRLGPDTVYEAALRTALQFIALR